MEKINFQNTRATIAKNLLADGMEQIIDLQKSHGSWMVDGRNGKEYLDLFSMFASMSIGYNHPYVLENKDRLTAAAINKPTNSDIYSPYMAELVQTLERVAQPKYLPNTFFIEGGGLAIENALKTAFDWKVRKNLENGIKNKGFQVIHFKEAFHGRSGYTLSLTNTTDPRKTMYFPKFNWPRIDSPYLSFPITDDVINEVKEKEDLSINQIYNAIKENPDDIAALIIEPIQGEGGDNQFREVCI